ncbi:hypothetical protein LGK95_09120 [Clostridium algoriphilum]|uniref:hypothetical protein n=1 Tax=Clostridium algoriphilum TaxID=198347 RepID=UPI001CF1C899|nr:hypothetical protein [Clostridium algoriphilum]MCB2293684.1 hypothetical protein [Clostridium algoriphilum]
MEDKEGLKKALLELLGEEENGRTGKRFFFPGNVEKGYNIVQGLSVTDVAKFIVPSLLLSTIIVVIPPYSSVFFWIIKGIFDCLILCTGFVMAILRPIKNRSNIKCLDYIKMRISFLNKQKMYYIKPKERGNLSNGTGK